MKLNKKIFASGLAATVLIGSSVFAIMGSEPEVTKPTQKKETQEVVEVQEPEPAPEVKAEEPQTAPVMPVVSAPVETPAPQIQHDPTTIEGVVDMFYSNFGEDYKTEAKRCLNLLKDKRPERFPEGSKVGLIQHLMATYRPAGICALADSIQ